MITVLDTRIYKDEIWFKVKLARNTEILKKKLYTEDEVEYLKQKAIKEYLHNLVDKMLDFNF